MIYANVSLFISYEENGTCRKFKIDKEVVQETDVDEIIEELNQLKIQLNQKG